MFILEYYSNDEQEWTTLFTPFDARDAAVHQMRVMANASPDMPHRVVKLERTTIALTTRGDELCR